MDYRRIDIDKLKYELEMWNVEGNGRFVIQSILKCLEPSAPEVCDCRCHSVHPPHAEKDCPHESQPDTKECNHRWIWDHHEVEEKHWLCGTCGIDKPPQPQSHNHPEPAYHADCAKCCQPDKWVHPMYPGAEIKEVPLNEGNTAKFLEAAEKLSKEHPDAFESATKECPKHWGGNGITYCSRECAEAEEHVTSAQLESKEELYERVLRTIAYNKRLSSTELSQMAKEVLGL